MSLLAILFILGLQVGLGILALMIVAGAWIADLA